MTNQKITYYVKSITSNQYVIQKCHETRNCKVIEIIATKGLIR